MNSSLVYKLGFIIIVIIGQILIPSITYNNFIVSVDILIIYLTYIGRYEGRFSAILVGFIFGFCQDIATQFDLLGVTAFIKSIIGYGLGSLILYENIWTRSYRIFFIMLMYLLHFTFYYFFKFNGMLVSSLDFIVLVLINTFISIAILYVIDKTFYNKSILSN